MLLEWMFRGGDTLYYFWPKDIIDLNGDGIAANISDITYFVDYLFGIPLGPPPHTPYDGIRQPPPHIVADDIAPTSIMLPDSDQPDRRQDDSNLNNDRLLDFDQRPDTDTRDHINSPPRPDDDQ